VNQHAGALHVRSTTRPGRSGSVFAIFLPGSPAAIGTRLRNLDALYAEWENSAATDANRRDSVTLATKSVLSDVQDLLHVG
jgi:hypothetical protein